MCGAAFGRVRAMFNTLKPTERMEEAGPSVPVNITGLDDAPAAGQKFYVLSDIAEARAIAQKRAADSKAESLGVVKKHITFENLFESLAQEETQTLNLILRADTRGSIEAIKKELTKLEHPEVQIRLLQATVGGISEADVHLADASNAVIIGFNVVPDEKSFNPPEWSPALRSPAGTLQVGIVNSARIDSARFQPAWTQALSAMRTDAVLEEWRNEARQRGWKLELLDSIGTNFLEGDVTLEQLPDGLLIRPGRGKSLEARISMFPKSTLRI